MVASPRLGGRRSEVRWAFWADERRGWECGVIARGFFSISAMEDSTYTWDRLHCWRGFLLDGRNPTSKHPRRKKL